MLNIYQKFSKGTGKINYTDELFGRGDEEIEDILKSSGTEEDLVRKKILKKSRKIMRKLFELNERNIC